MSGKNWLYIFVLMFLSNILFCQYDSWNVELVGRGLGGICKAIYPFDEVCLTSAGTRLDVVNLSDVTSPVMTSSIYFSGRIIDIAVSGNYAYICADIAGLRIVDVSDLSAVHEIASVSIDEACCISIQDTFAYVTSGTDDLSIVNIADPFFAYRVGTIDSTARARDVVVVGQYVFLAAFHGGLRIIDISNPELPIQISCFDSDNMFNDIAVDGDYVFLADADSGLCIIDVSDIEHPFELITIEFNRPTSLAIHDEVLGISNAEGRTTIFDCSNPAYPIRRGSYFTSALDNIQDSYIIDHILYRAFLGSGLELINIHDMDSLYGISIYGTGSQCRDVYVAGDFAYIANYIDGLKILDITDPSEPVLIGSYSRYIITDVRVSGRYAYLAKHYHGIDIVDISNPFAPYSVQSVYLPGYLQDVYVAGDYIYTANSYEGWYIIDISEPETAHEIAHIGIDGVATGVSVLGNYAYLVSRDGTLRVIDVSDPASPSVVVDIAAGHYGSGIFIYADYAFVNLGGDHIFDISNPLEPIEIVSLESPRYSSNGKCLIGDILYSINSDGLVVYDVSDLCSIEEVGYFNVGCEPKGIFIDGDFLYLITSYEGLFILDISHFTSWHSSTPLSLSWNMLSFPFEEGATLDELPPATIAPVYGFEAGTYEATDTFRTGEGYYVLSSSDTVATIEGRAPVYSVTMELVPGWNVVGGPYSTVSPICPK